MDTISIRGEVLAGSNVFDAISDGIELAKKLDVPIVINFNGCTIYLQPGDDVHHECHEYRRWVAAGG